MSDIQQRLREGYAGLTAGRFDVAMNACREILARDPKCVPAHFLVGLIGVQRRDLKTAISAFGSVTRLQNDHVAAWAQLAHTLLQSGQIAPAEHALARALALGSSDPVVQDLLGTVLGLLGDRAAADAWHRRAAAARPDVAALQLNHASNLIALGRAADARHALDAALAADADNAQAHWMLANARTATDQQHIARMQTLRKKYAGRPAALAFVEYAIGKEYEDLEQWGDAFAAFARGAAAKRAAVDYDEAGDQATFDTIAATFTPQWCAASRAGSDDASPIFIVGLPRTGTTLLERIVSSHSQVQSAGEVQQFPYSVRRMTGISGVPRHAAAIFAAAANVDTKALGELYLGSTTHLRGNKPHFVDKLPLNFLYVGLIAKALPNARIVHVTRNAIDSCFANYKQLFADAYFHSYDQREMARHYVRYRRLMQHWAAVVPGRFIDVAYEDLTADLEREARRVLAHLALPWEDACIAFHRNSAAVSTASAIQVREPVYRRSVDRWRRYEAQLQPTIDVLRDARLV